MKTISITAVIVVLALGIASQVASGFETMEFMAHEYKHWQSVTFTVILSAMIFALWNLSFLRFDRWAFGGVLVALSLSAFSVFTVYSENVREKQQAHLQSESGKNTDAKNALSNAIQKLEENKAFNKSQLDTLLADIKESKAVIRTLNGKIAKNIRPNGNSRLLLNQQRSQDKLIENAQALRSVITKINDEISEKEAKKGEHNSTEFVTTFELGVLLRSALWDASTPLLALINSLLLLRLKQRRDDENLQSELQAEIDKQQADLQAGEIIETAKTQAENIVSSAHDEAETQKASVHQYRANIEKEGANVLHQAKQESQHIIDAAKEAAKKIADDAEDFLKTTQRECQDKKMVAEAEIRESKVILQKERRQSEIDAESIINEAKISAQEILQTAGLEAKLHIEKAKTTSKQIKKEQSAKQYSDEFILSELANGNVKMNNRGELTNACLLDQYGIKRTRAKRLFTLAVEAGTIVNYRTVYQYAEQSQSNVVTLQAVS